MYPWSKAGDKLSSRHVSSRDIKAYSWDGRGDLTLNSVALIRTSGTLLTSHDLAWITGRLTCQHASEISAVAHISWDVTYVSSALQTLPAVSRNVKKCLLKKCANGPFYTTPSHQIIEISIWEPTHGKGYGRSWKKKPKFYVRSRDVRIVCPRLNRIRSYRSLL